MLDPLGQSDLVQEIHRPCPSPGPVHPRNDLRHHHILERSEVAQQVVKLKNEADKFVPHASQFLIAHPGQIPTAE
jgi:hypothetical protein